MCQSHFDPSSGAVPPLADCHTWTPRAECERSPLLDDARSGAAAPRARLLAALDGDALDAAISAYLAQHHHTDVPAPVRHRRRRSRWTARP